MKTAEASLAGAISLAAMDAGACAIVLDATGFDVTAFDVADFDVKDLGRLRRAETATTARVPPATLRLTGRLPVLRRTLGVLDLLSSLRLRSGISSALVFFLALARLAARFSASFFALRSAFFCSLAFSRNRSARASARFFLRFFSHATHLQPIGFR